jgi:hypothetical protein
MVNLAFVGSLSAMVILLAPAGVAGDQAAPSFTTLFVQDGPPEGWVVRRWDDVSEPAEATWSVRDGVLHGGEPRGTWLMSERMCGDFELQFEFKLGPQGNSGLALRAPLDGDPAFDGLELQMADVRYNPQAKDYELTGGVYRAVAPRRQAYKPERWNRYDVLLVGARLRVRLNGELIQDVNLDEQAAAVKRHDGSVAPPVNRRPRRGHIGFQELSRGEGHVQIRDARIKVLD